jgi:hypothetical protein
VLSRTAKIVPDYIIIRISKSYSGGAVTAILIFNNYIVTEREYYLTRTGGDRTAVDIFPVINGFAVNCIAGFNCMRIPA